MNVIEIFAKFVMDTSGLDDGLNDAEKKTSSFGSVIGSGLAGAAKIGAAALATTATAAIGAATAVAAVAKQSADAYAEYQQLQGGVETLFNDGGKAAADYRAELEAAGASEAEIARAMADFKDPTAQVLENASNAYKTAGMSANQYMDTVINMAASLNKATGDAEESTRLADMAIIDMSDNVNKMGTSMESVQNAYRGFTRGNFTMLDNLALGYAGTKEGMEELLADAEKISGVEYDISSYADIVQAIHVVQEQMGITGTTAAEASETISGSAGALAAAWDNLILGLSDSNANLGELIDNVVESAKTAFTNILPAFTQAIRGIGNLVGEIAPVIADEFPGLVDQVLPPLLDAASSLIENVVKAIPELLDVIMQNGDIILDSLLNVGSILIDGVLDILSSALTAISEQLPVLLPKLVAEIMDMITTLLSSDNISMFIELGISLITNLYIGILKAIPELIKALPEIVINIVEGIANSIEPTFDMLVNDMAPMLQDMIKSLLTNGDVISGIEDALNTLSDILLPLLGETIPRLIDTWVGMMDDESTQEMADAIPKIFESLGRIFAESGAILLKFSAPIIEALLPIIPMIVDAFVKAMVMFTPVWVEAFKAFFAAIGEVFADPEFQKTINDGVMTIINSLLGLSQELYNILMLPIVEKVLEWWDELKGTGESKLAEIWETVTTKLDEIWQSVLDFLAPILNILVPYFTAVGNLFHSLFNLAVVIFKLVWQTIKNALEKIWSKIQEVWQAIIDFVSPILDDIKAKVEEIWNGIVEFLTPVIDGLKTTIDEAFQFIYDNAVQPLLDLKDKIEEIFNGIKDFILEFVDGALDWGGDMINNFAQGITDGLGTLTDAIDDVTGKLSANLEHSVPDEGPLSDDDKWMPDMMQSFAKGIRDNTSLVDNAITDAFNFKGLLGGNGSPAGGLITPTASQPVEVTLVLDKQQLGKVIFDLNKQESRRMGVSLANV